MNWRLWIGIGTSVFSAACLAAVPPKGAELLLPAGPAQRVAGAPAFLDLGPMLGHVSSTNALIWAKASGPARLGVRIGQKEDLSEGRVVSGPLLEAASGFMGALALTGLQSSRRYFYSVLLDSRPAMLPPYPAFDTAPVEGAQGRVRFAFTSCVGYHGYDAAPGYADLATRTNFDLLLMLGDNHYANTSAAPVQRRYYADQRRQSGWRELAAHIPIYAIWDDHDFGPDNSDGRMKGKAEALQTFKQHWANPAYGEPDNPGVYFKFTRGDVDFFMLDGRYHRDPNKATNLVGKTMLGAKQIEWFKRELLASKARVKVLVSGGEWQSKGTDDSWTSFKREREEIFQFIEDYHLQGVLLISGDRHYTAAYQVLGKWIEVTSGPLGSANAAEKNLPEMFLNFSNTKAKLYCVYDLDTSLAEPAVTLEVYRVGEGLAERRRFTWDEVLGKTPIKTLPASTKPKS
jgi:alkaline phosphatase D